MKQKQYQWQKSLKNFGVDESKSVSNKTREYATTKTISARQQKQNTPER